LKLINFIYWKSNKSTQRDMVQYRKGRITKRNVYNITGRLTRPNVSVYKAYGIYKN